ncbi:MAG: bacteriochlorophyll 4-vinyl reductase [Pseudomonadota bacterium]
MVATPHPGASDSSKIGPNAILQYLPVLADQLGDVRMRALLNAARLAEMPDGSSMIDEAEVRRLHQTVRCALPQSAPALAARAGAATAQYIVRHRIPALVKPLLRWLPARLAERFLAKAIRQHAWTFVGSGEFRVASTSPLVFEITHNPLVRGEEATHTVCDWHAAVFSELFTTLLGRRYMACETHCEAFGASVCRFEVEASA